MNAAALVLRVQRAARSASSPVEVRIDGEIAERRCPAAWILRANVEDADTFGSVLALRPGETVRLGGGAAPVVDVRRWA